MRIHTALAASLILIGSLFQASASATDEPRALLKLIVVDQANAALPAAAVTIYTADGNPGMDVTADDRGVVLVPSMSVGYAQIHARYPGHAPYIQGTRLERGENVLRVTLPSRSDDEAHGGS